MKKILFSALAVVLCGSMMAQNSAVLKLNLEKNKVYKHKSNSDLNITQSVNGMQQAQQMKNQSYLSIKMVDSKPEFMIAEVRFDSIVTKINAMGQTIVNNSNKPGDMKSANAAEITSAILNRFCNNPLFVKMDYSGKVLEVVNLKMFSDVVTKGLDSAKVDPSTKNQLTSMVKLEAIKPSIEGAYALLPGKSVNIGDTWEVSNTINSNGMNLTSTSKFKLVSLSNNVATLAAESNIAAIGGKPMETNGMKINYDDLKGLGKSTILVDMKTGLIKDVTGKSNIAGNLSLDMAGTNMQIPLEIQIESKVEPIQ
ncbi:MAG TPA: DUF6263 family protein [Bacteroidales bacterium]|nr:DUF6263 family protein [Bacteroidales bacterium]